MAVDVLAEILTNRALSSDYNVIAFHAPEIATRARPGQFVMVRPTNGQDPLLRRPFSIFEILRDANGAPTGVSILNKKIGVGTTKLYEAQPGQRLSLLGPLGKSWLDAYFIDDRVMGDRVIADRAVGDRAIGPHATGRHPTGDHPISHHPISGPPITHHPINDEVWFVAGGVGLAPFVTLAEHFQSAGVPMTLFYGGRTAADLHYSALFETLGATLVLTTEDGSRGEPGRVTGPLERALKAGARPGAIYACGPTPMMRAAAALGVSAGVPTVVSLEPVMGCGMGGCYSCVVKVSDPGGAHFVRSCLDGPVFNAARVVWDALVH